MFHRFSELSTNPVLVSVTQYQYAPTSATTPLSALVSVMHTGYQYDPKSHTYQTASLPALQLGYSVFSPTEQQFVALTASHTPSFPGFSRFPYTLVDLYGEGLPDILYADGTSTYYREPIATPATSHTSAPPPQYASWQTSVFPIQRRVDGHATFMDINADAQLDLVVLEPELQGYWAANRSWEAQTSTKWQKFCHFLDFPAEYPAPGQTWVDITGNGLSDLYS